MSGDGYLAGSMVMFIGLALALASTFPSTPVQRVGDLTVEVSVHDVSQIGEYYVVKGRVIFSFKSTSLPVALNFSNARVLERSSDKTLDDKTIVVSFTAVTNSTVLTGTANVDGITQVPISFDAVKLHEQQKSRLMTERILWLVGGVGAGSLIMLATYLQNKRHDEAQMEVRG